MTAAAPETSAAARSSVAISQHVSRLLIVGAVAAAATPATANGMARELRLDVGSAGRWAVWRVLLATPEAIAEAAELVEGDAVAFVGVASEPRFPDDSLARFLTADRALALRRAPPSAAMFGPGVEPPFDARAAFGAMLDRVQSLAMVMGATAERGRIIAITGAPEAKGHLALAWRLAESGLDVETALQALLIAKIEAEAAQR